jgi:hypothetical protein
MAELEHLLLSITERQLAPPATVAELERRGRRRARRRRATRTMLVVGCLVAVAVPTLAIVDDHRSGEVVRATQTPTSVIPAPTTPSQPTGRFVPSYLPEGLSLVSEDEAVPALVAQGGPPGRFRIYDNDPSGNGDVISTSFSTDAPALDVDSEVSRYPGARKVEVQGQAALFLPPVTARRGWVVAWAPARGQLAQVTVNATGRVGGGAGLGDDGVLELAESLRLPELDGTPLPAGFALRRGQAYDSRSLAPPVPRQWLATYSDVSREHHATGIAPNAANRRSVTITSSWRSGLPSGASTKAVRGHDAVAPSSPDGYRSLSWEERPGLQVTVTGERLAEDELRRVAEGLREQSVDEVLSRPSGSPAVVGSAEVAGTTYELVTSRRPTGICVELRGARDAGRGIACGFDPAAAMLRLEITTRGEPRIMFGMARPAASRVRVEFPGSEPVQAKVFSAEEATYWLAALPDEQPVTAVVALDAGGRVLERLEILPEPPTAPPPPWSAAKVAASQAPAELVEAWRADGRRQGCAALMLTDQGQGAGATPRIASFGADAWAVAFDKPGLPGTTAEGRPSPDSGRSAFGVAGTSIDVGVKRVEGWPEHRIWRDGSRADYGPEGGTGPKWLAQLYVRGQRCLYNVWSAVGKEHLERLVDGIRFVEGAP